jgi:hypothetical protein
MSEDFVSADIHHEHVSHESEEKATRLKYQDDLESILDPPEW